jgi:hypothetical protein
MAFPTNVLALASAVGSQFLATAWGGTVGMAAGLNQILADLIAVETKIGTGASTAAANTVLRGTGSGTTAFGQIVSGDITDGTIVAADISSSAAIAATQLAAGAANSVLAGGASNAFTTTPTVASLTTTAALQGGTTVKAGARIFPGALAPATGVQANASLQMPYLNSALSGNNSFAISSFPVGVFWLFDLTTASMSQFTSNSISTLVDRGSDATIQIGGADPGASSSKVWISMSSGSLQILNRYAAAHFLILMGLGAN